MQKLICTLAITLFIAGIAPAQKRIGSNMNSVTDYSTELIFVDVFKQSREWISYSAGGSWSSGVDVPLRPDGYPVEIPYNNGIDPPQHVRALMLIDIDGYYPSGEYRLKVAGTGQIRLWGSASGTYACPMDELITIDNLGGGLFLEMDSSAAADPIHDIQLVLPGSHDTYESAPFNPLFLDFIEDFEVIRFMDFMRTNFSPVVSWSDRSPYDYYTQTLESGVAYEYLIEMCNLTQKDAWVCIPHLADDDFVTQFATLLRDSLDPNLKIYVEYSNEAWNGIFSQTQHVQQIGDSLGYEGQPWEQGWQYFAKRSADIHTIFESVFADDKRIVNVLASQSIGYVCDYILDRYSEVQYNPSQVQAEAMAIAPYFGGGLADEVGDAGMENTITVAALLDSLEATYLPASYAAMREVRDAITEHNVELIAYEGGQHLVSYAYADNESYVDTLIEVNRHPRMQDLYCQYFNYWYDSIQGGVFVHYTSHSRPSRHGSWGIKEYYADTLNPKYLAIKSCVLDEVIASVNFETMESNAVVYPNPTSGEIYLGAGLSSGNYSLLSSVGERVLQGSVEEASVDMSSLKMGVYILQVKADNGERYVVKVIKD